MTVGSSPKTSSPTSASAIARRIRGRGPDDGVGAEVDEVGHGGGGYAGPGARPRPDGALLSFGAAARTRGVAAQHASLSRWRSPVRIRSGPPVPNDDGRMRRSSAQRRASGGDRPVMTRPLPDTTTRSRLASRVLVLGARRHSSSSARSGSSRLSCTAGEADERGPAPTPRRRDRPPRPRPRQRRPAVAPSAAEPHRARPRRRDRSPALPRPSSRSAVPVPSPLASPAAALEGEAVATMPVVPVAGFWSTDDPASPRAMSRRALETGRTEGFRRVVVEDGIRDALATALGATISAPTSRAATSNASSAPWHAGPSASSPPRT